jgi:glycosyltransferase involved in cell wall biosynthesis
MGDLRALRQKPSRPPSNNTFSRWIAVLKLSGKAQVSFGKPETAKMNIPRAVIAFETVGAKEWIAGDIYLGNLLHTLTRHSNQNISLCLFSAYGNHVTGEYAQSLGAPNVIRFTAPQPCSLSWVFNAASKLFLSTDRSLKKVLEKNGIGTVFGLLLRHKCPGVAFLSWLPDFQHMHLPELFSEGERQSRDRVFRETAELSTRVILPCEAALKDFATFAPDLVRKGRAFHPVSIIPESIYECDPRMACELYNLPDQFVFLPNQFWKHKNHEAVFKAVRILKDRGLKVVLVCTGYPGDSRDQKHFADLFRKLAEWNIRDRIVYLGIIPHEHVLLLMRQSVCVINPSLFEGWGISVDEARSVGKQMLLSDIPAHREQNPPKSSFFDPQDYDTLAEKLSRVWTDGKPGPDVELEYRARNELPGRLRSIAQGFISLCKDAREEVAHCMA